MPANADDIVCSGSYCAVLCSEGYRSQDIWRIKCKPNNKWSHEAFSPCITCSDIDLSNSNIFSYVTYRRKLPLIQVGCSDSISKLIVANFTFKQGTKMAKFRCACRRHIENGLRYRRKCEWRYRGQLMINFKPIQCLNVPELVAHSKPFHLDIGKLQFKLENCLTFKFKIIFMKNQNYLRYFK